MTQEEYEMTCFQMITAAGTAKSDYIEALRAAKTGDYAKAEELLASGLKATTPATRHTRRWCSRRLPAILSPRPCS